MIKRADIRLQDNVIQIGGDLTYANVMQVFDKSVELIKSLPEWQFDFSRLRSSDSAGLALMIEWLKLAQVEKKIVGFSGISGDLLAIAKATGLMDLLQACPLPGPPPCTGEGDG